MKMRSFASFLFIMVAGILAFAPQLSAQSNSSASAAPAKSPDSSGAQTQPPARLTNHFLWTEEYDGSTNSEGQVTSLDSSVGYVFSQHFGIDAGVPIYFVHGTFTTSTGGTATVSNNGIGDAYLQLRFAFPSPFLNYNAVLTGTVPTGSTSSGLSTGHATYDWTNHFDHKFGRLVPFAEAGVGNSIPENFVFNRPFKSFGHVAHFQAGTGFQVSDWLGFSASAYDIAPWGNQEIFSRLVSTNGGPMGLGGHGRVFNTANQTTGGSSLSADNGFSAGAEISPGSILDFQLGYSHSVHFQLDTFSFGVGIDMSKLLRSVRSGT